MLICFCLKSNFFTSTNFKYNFFVGNWCSSYSKFIQIYVKLCPMFYYSNVIQQLQWKVLCWFKHFHCQSWFTCNYFVEFKRKWLVRGIVPLSSELKGGSLVFSELPLSQVSVDAGWPCLQLLAFWKCLLACRTIEKNRKSNLHPPARFLIISNNV